MRMSSLQVEVIPGNFSPRMARTSTPMATQTLKATKQKEEQLMGLLKVSLEQWTLEVSTYKIAIECDKSVKANNVMLIVSHRSPWLTVQA
jgi:hypothetical protein